MSTTAANFILSNILGLGLVTITSPTSPVILLLVAEKGPFITYEYLLSAVDLTLALVISFLVLCNLEHKWIAKNYSFPYAFHPVRNLGAKALQFQLVLFEVYHLHLFSRITHILTLLVEEAAWLFLIQGTFGAVGLATANALLALQAFSYGDALLGACITTLNLAVSLAAAIGFQGVADGGGALGGIKIGLVLCAALRTASHVAEPLPPAYNESSKTFERSFGVSGFEFLFSNTLFAFWLFCYGVIQEMGAGMPGRLFNIAVAEVMYSAGYQGKSAWDVVVAKGWACEIVERGWEAYPMSQELLAWVAVRDDSGYPIL
ncbi:hypothetical protein X797_006126 [Metarhizium robertsii]|uniref:Uncharacterized protein n=2 Tax=Metarhizium robertsii TaxID=568076 RepID=E9F4R6_METRA|nr:uncharacterized protein MAA_07265 [Metarhizium robertsii ARSEF 23]EFY97248.1 hypothetical protein MAA_07265 [Metarhizium robertsii ARSEF 23]EXV00718.1 hypothetical protein X797_006126 [Metarhizium robertsii]